MTGEVGVIHKIKGGRIFWNTVYSYVQRFARHHQSYMGLAFERKYSVEQEHGES